MLQEKFLNKFNATGRCGLIHVALGCALGGARGGAGGRRARPRAGAAAAGRAQGGVPARAGEVPPAAADRYARADLPALLLVKLCPS